MKVWQSIVERARGWQKRVVRHSDADTVYVKDNPTEYRVGGGWGNRIEWMSDFKTPAKQFRVVGWKPTIPDKGDVMTAQMQSGKTARFVFLTVEPQQDPPDMFFADVGFLGYDDVVPNR